MLQSTISCTLVATTALTRREPRGVHISMPVRRSWMAMLSLPLESRTMQWPAKQGLLDRLYRAIETGAWPAGGSRLPVGFGAGRLSKESSSSLRQLLKRGESLPYCRGPGSLKLLHIWYVWALRRDNTAERNQIYLLHNISEMSYSQWTQYLQ